MPGAQLSAKGDRTAPAVTTWLANRLSATSRSASTKIEVAFAAPARIAAASVLAFATASRRAATAAVKFASRSGSPKTPCSLALKPSVPARRLAAAARAAATRSVNVEVLSWPGQCPSAQAQTASVVAEQVTE